MKGVEGKESVGKWEGWKGRNQLGSGRGGREVISWEVGGVGGKESVSKKEEEGIHEVLD